MNLLLLLLMTIIPQENPEFPHPKFTLECYPKTVMPGDRLYIKMIAKNPHNKPVYPLDCFGILDYTLKIHLRDTENQVQFLLSEIGVSPLRFHVDFIYNVIEILPGDSRLIAMRTINVPPLEDLKEPFWEKHLKNLSTNEEKFSLCITVRSISGVDAGLYDREKLSTTLEVPIAMKPRPEKEMALIQKWYDETPDNWFPVPYDERFPAKIPSKRQYRLPIVANVLIKGEKVAALGRLVTLDNRYPGHRNIPETWQGWKELEESLTPSTMRDEIRFTRILIQYSDTDDEAVLKELKDWFADMNEVQRSVLIRRTSKGKMYEAIKEFDTATLK